MTRALATIVALLYLCVGLAASALIVWILVGVVDSGRVYGPAQSVAVLTSAAVALIAAVVAAAGGFSAAYAFLTLRRWGRPLVIGLNVLFMIASMSIAVSTLSGVVAAVRAAFLLSVAPAAIIIFCLTRPVKALMVR